MLPASTMTVVSYPHIAGAAKFQRVCFVTSFVFQSDVARHRPWACSFAHAKLSCPRPSYMVSVVEASDIGHFRAVHDVWVPCGPWAMTDLGCFVVVHSTYQTHLRVRQRQHQAILCLQSVVMLPPGTLFLREGFPIWMDRRRGRYPNRPVLPRYVRSIPNLRSHGFSQHCQSAAALG